MTAQPHSAPVSRRRFNGIVSAAAGSLVLHPLSLSAAPKSPEFSFLVVSDTHLGYRDQEGAARRWSQTVAELAELPGDFVLHLGDVVDGGREAQYPVYMEARRKIGKPVYEIPGNHDPREAFAKHIRTPIDTAFDHGGMRFVLLGNAHRDSHDGFITEEQLGWLDGQLRQAAEKELLVMLSMHVPAHANRPPDRAWYVKPDEGQTGLYELIDRHRERIVALMHGHFHNGIRGWHDRDGLHEILFPSVLYNQNRGLTEKMAPGYNLEEFRPGYVLVTLKQGAMMLEYKPVGQEVSVSKRCDLAVTKQPAP